MKEYFPKPTEQQKKDLALLYTKFNSQGFNIFTFMARVRKQKGYFPPVEAILKIGTTALKTKPTNLWAYFTVALKKEFPKYFADLNIKEGERFKKGPVVIGDVMKRLTMEAK